MRTTLGALGLIVSLAAPALAGPHLRWDACRGEAAARANRTFACDTDAEAFALVGSYTLAESLSGIRGIEVVLDLAADAAALPAWWDLFNAGSCRPTAMSVSFQRDPGWTACEQRTTPATSAGGIAAYRTFNSPGFPVNGPNRARILIAQGVADQAEFSLDPGSAETFAFVLTIDSESTTACEGCAVPVCIAFTRLGIAADHGTRMVNYAGWDGGNQDWFVSWQGPATPPGGCPGSTPARNATWGRLKWLYR